ncbi:MAG: hypothetical protein ACRENE_03055, partial [Polyangiaceae bacterium]
MTTAPSSGSPDTGALDALEALVASDPGDDDLRRRYVEVAVAVGDPRRAAEALKGAIKRRKSSEVRERVTFDVAMLYLKDGELEPARQSLLDVVVVGAGGPAALAAARRLLELEGEPGNPKVKEVALEALTKLSTEARERHDAATQLLALHATSPLKAARLASAYEALVDSPRADEALAWLRTHYAKRKDQNGLSEVYRTLALRSPDAGEGRTLALESIRLAKDATPEKRAERWLWLVERFGPDREAFAQLVPLLEDAQRHPELRRVLEADLKLAPPDERPAILARLGELLAIQLNEVDAALDAFRRCLEADPKNAMARRAVERMMRAGDRRLEAAAILGPLYEREGDPEGRLAVLETRANLQPYTGSRLLAFVEAVEVAAGAGLKDRALAACRNAINLDPSSPELHEKYDDLVRGTEGPGERLSRHEDALGRATDPQRRSRLLYTVAAIRHAAGDVRGAMGAWQRIIEQTPSDAVAFERLLDATVSAGDDDAVVPLLDRACANVGAAERPGMILRKAVWLADHGGGTEAAELCNQVVDEPLRPSQLEAIVQIARDQDEDLLHRHALELLSASADAHASSQALEQLGDFQYERLGDRRAAATSWKAAAVVYAEADREHAQSLFERALETLPDDLGAAERLVDLYASTGAWMPLLGTLRLFIRSGDLGRAAEHLLLFKDRAIEGGAADEVLALASEILEQVGAESPDWLTPLKKARSRVLLADPGRQAEASEALRDLIESLGQPDDVRAYERFADSNPSAEERHRERRWLARWREGHAADPTDVLLESARAELDYGDPEAARTAYERVLTLHPEHASALEAVCRLRFQAGDFDGGLAALQDLRLQIGDEQGLSLTLRMVEWMWSERGRPGEAAQLLAPLLTVEPLPGQDAPERVLARGMLGDPTIRGEVIEHLEAFAVANPAAERPILEFLLDARHATEGMSSPRRRWAERIVELSADAPE